MTQDLQDAEISAWIYLSRGNLPKIKTKKLHGSYYSVGDDVYDCTHVKKILHKEL